MYVGMCRKETQSTTVSYHKQAYTVERRPTTTTATKMNALLVFMYGIYVNGAHDMILALDLSGFS